MAETRPDPYEGNICPGCHKIAWAFKGGHEAGCAWWAPTPGRKR